MFKSKSRFWSWLKWRKTYAQIWIYFTCACMGILLISTIFLYVLSSNTIFQTIGNYSESQLSTNAENTSFAMNWNFDYSQRMSLDTTIREYAFLNNQDASVDHTVWIRLNDLKQSNPYIDSIYLINAYNQTIIDSNLGVFTMNDFYDQEIIKLIKDKETFINQLLVPRQRVPNEVAITQQKLLTIVIPFEPTNSISSLVVNLNSDALLPLSNNSKGNTYFIINNSGIIISSNRESAFLNNFNDIVSSAKFASNTGWFETIVSSNKKLVVHANFSVRGLEEWRLIEFIPESSLIGNIRKFQMWTLVFFTLLLVISFIVIRKLSRKIYSPIQELVMSVTNRYSGQQAGTGNEKELSYLSEIFSEQSQKLEDYDRNQKFEKREVFLKDLLENSNYPALDQMQQTFNQFDILLPVTSLSIALFRIDHFHIFTQHYSDRDQRLLRYAMANIIKEHLLQFFPIEAIEKGKDHIVVIYHIDSESFNVIHHQNFQSCRDLIGQYLSLETSITMGPYMENYLELHETYEMVFERSNERFKLGWGCFIPSIDETAESDQPFDYPKVEEQQLMLAIKKGNMEQISRELADIWNLLKLCSYAECKLTITNLILSIGKNIHQLTFQKVQTNQWSLSFIQELIERLETMDAIYQWLEQQLSEAVEEIQIIKSTPSSSQLIQDIKLVIIENIENQNLSTKSIADQLGLSVNYIRHVFKTELAQSIIDYISDLRLEKAMYQLLHTDLPIDFIAMQSGFTTRITFYSIFKKKYGTTPALYRKNNIKPKSEL